jgi:fumarate hydratase subunit alpha
VREIATSKITETIVKLCHQANYELGEDVVAALRKAEQTEESPLGRAVLRELLENAQIAREGLFPLCQDCGTAVVFLEVGQDVHIVGGDLHAAVEEGVRQGYTQSYLRKSMVRQPFSARINTGDNTPVVLHNDIVTGERLRIVVMSKGGGAENMSRLAMLKPAQGREGIVEAVVTVVDEAGGMPCPPLIIGLGIGGTAEMTMLLAKKSLLRPVGQPSHDPEVAELERDILERVNNLGIGPMGLGGRTTALAVHAEVMPAHIASLPLAINLQCHSARHREAIL